MHNCYSYDELAALNVICGINVQISRLTQIYCSSLTIGNDVRIDDFCVLTGNIKMGNNIHISNYCGLYGNGGLELEDFCGVSGKVCIYTASDDFSGESLTNPTVPDEYKNVKIGKVVLRKHVIIGAGTTILPGVEIGQCSAVGAMSLVYKSINGFEIHAGNPARYLKRRSVKLLELEKQYGQSRQRN